MRMKVLLYIVLLASVVAIVAAPCSAEWLAASVEKVIVNADGPVLAVQPHAGGELIYGAITGDEIHVNRFIAVAMMAQAHRITVHIYRQPSLGAFTQIATVTE